MTTIFSKIIEGDLPARFVWRDETCVAFLSINPLRDGHTLVVPVQEVDHWLDVPTETWNHMNDVARTIGQAQMEAFQPKRIGMMLAGLEVPHCHIHVVPIWGVHDLDFANAAKDPDPDGMDRAAASLRSALQAAGASGVAD